MDGWMAEWMASDGDGVTKSHEPTTSLEQMNRDEQQWARFFCSYSYFYTCKRSFGLSFQLLSEPVDDNDELNWKWRREESAEEYNMDGLLSDIDKYQQKEHVISLACLPAWWW